MNERRAAVRLIQPSSLEPETSGASLTGLSSPRGPQLVPTAPAPQVALGRRRSVCFPLSVADELGTDAVEGRSNACAGSTCSGGSSTSTTTNGQLSPAHVRRSVPEEDGGGIRLGSSPPGSGDPDSHHLSVPLTLLSLNNGGVRHATPRSSRDISPMISLIPSREASFTSVPDAATVSSGGNASSPLRRTSSGVSSLCGNATSGAPPVAPALRPGALGTSGSTSLSPRDGVVALSRRSAEPVPGGTGPAACSSAVPTSAAVPTGVMPAAAPAASCGALGSGNGSSPSGACSITVPGHLCTQRPPTPLCKEDDLMASMRHLASPTRRRSRFASAADSSLLAAAAAAIAAEEAGLLESPPPSFTSPSGGARSSLPAPGDPPALRPLVVPGAEPPPWGAASPSGAASRRCPSQLGTVQEEILMGGGSSKATTRPGSSLPGGAPGPAPGTPTAGRRRRGSSTEADAALSSPEGEAGPSGAPRASFGGAGGTAGSTAPAAGVNGPADDALSSFMHSFGPNSQAARCPTPSGGQPAALQGGGTGRITAR